MPSFGRFPNDELGFGGCLSTGIKFDLDGSHGIRETLDYLQQCECEPEPPDLEAFIQEREEKSPGVEKKLAFQSLCSDDSNSLTHIPQSKDARPDFEAFPKDELEGEEFSFPHSASLGETLDTDDLSKASPESRDITGCSSIDTNRIGGNLMYAKKEARLRLLRLRIPTLLFGGLFLLHGVALSIIVGRVGISWMVFAALIVLGIFSLLLSLLPTDRRAVPCVAIFSEVLYFSVVANNVMGTYRYTSMAAAGDCVLNDHAVPCWLIVGKAVEAVLMLIGFLITIVLILIPLIHKAPSEIVLSRLWSATGFALSQYGVVNLIAAGMDFAVGYTHWGVTLAGVGIVNLLFGIVMWFGTSSRRHVQSWFMSRGEATAAAAGIANLLGGMEVGEILKCARGNFSYIRADRILFEDMQDNTPNPRLSALTEKGRIGLVDAFVSHSWHDDPIKKWAALQDFREAFKLKHKREPKMWIDKYCIDQRNIETSLACLPVFLAGCSQLLVLCGETYLNRLWCLIEIYVFLEMGREFHRLDVRVFEVQQRTSQSSDQSSRNSVASIKKYDEFDPRKARCFTDYDTKRLQDVIEVFGYEQITKLVKDVFRNHG